MRELLQGLGIGFAIAAPVGPIGLLCIRRTLQCGRATGLVTGLGAAAADAMYGLAAVAGLSSTGWLTAHSVAMRLAGALVLAWLGMVTLRSFFARRAAPAADVRPTPGSQARTFASTFALTIANPTTFISFLGVVSAFGSSAGAARSAWLLVPGVFLGSMAWWLTLVAVVGRARTVLSGAVLRWIDLATGLALLAVALGIVARTWSAGA